MAVDISQPWYTYPSIGNYGSYPDPMGSYPKPDVNICAPAGTPITALAPGYVSGVQYPSWSNKQPSVTVALDNPLNNLATHMAYNFLDSATVKVGQQISQGDVIGYAKGTGVCTALALTPDPVYGTTSFAQTAGNPLLNPTGFLNNLTGGTSGLSSTSSSSGSSAPGLLGQLGAFGDWLGNPIRIIKMVIGGALIIVGVFMTVSK